MKTMIKPMVVAVSILASSTALAVDPKRVGECADYAQRYQATAEAKERFGQLKGSCEGVYDINGALYAKADMVVRSIRAGTVKLYLPASDKTIEVKPDMNRKVYVNGAKRRVRDLERGDKVQLYISLDKFFTERINEVAFAADDTDTEEAYVTPATEVAALPTTASQLPALALVSGLFLAGGFLLRVYRRRA